MFNFGFDDEITFCNNEKLFPFIKNQVDQKINISKFYKMINLVLKIFLDLEFF